MKIKYHVLFIVVTLLGPFLFVTRIKGCKDTLYPPSGCLKTTFFRIITAPFFLCDIEN